MQVFTKLSELRAWRSDRRKTNETVALVPTMGALHAGHLQLVAEAKKYATHVVVSIFVNPTQFGPNEDFSRYPRPVDKDIALLKEAGASALWLPSVEEMYPEGFATTVHVAQVSDGLCGDFRPGHFDGVATVVSKLLLQVQPEDALFGEKDYQQLRVITRMVTDLNLDVRIHGVPTIREADGLARSSRNQYLSETERQTAAQLHAVLCNTAQALINAPANVKGTLEKATAVLLAGGFNKVDYLALVAADTLEPQHTYQAPARLLVAAYLGSTRLIDNMAVEEGASC